MHELREVSPLFLVAGAVQPLHMRKLAKRALGLFRYAGEWQHALAKVTPLRRASCILCFTAAVVFSPVFLLIAFISRPRHEEPWTFVRDVVFDLPFMYWDDDQ